MKKDILFWSDAANASTGFGVVSKHLMDGLYKTGQYNLSQLAINFIPEFFDRDKYPYNIIPARLADPSDPYGSKMFLRAIQQKEYDFIFIINDSFVTHQLAEPMKQILKGKRSKTIYYFPVDCAIRPDFAGMIKAADIPVAYNHWSARKTIAVVPEVKDRLRVIYHGVDPEVYKPVSIETRRDFRKKVFGIDSDDTYLLINVNRNNPRKDIARTILAFAEFRKQVPDSKLYLHTCLVDRGAGAPLDLGPAIRELGLSTSKDVIVPVDYSPAQGYPEEILNNIYNAADCFISTSLGEGAGLCLLEAQSACVPVITGEHTSSYEIFGEERGILYPCKEQIWIDNSAFRYMGHMEDIVKALMKVYNMSHSDKIRMTQKGRLFAEKYSWDNVVKEWIDLFNNAEQLVKVDSNKLSAECL